MDQYKCNCHKAVTGINPPPYRLGERGINSGIISLIVIGILIFSPPFVAGERFNYHIFLTVDAVGGIPRDDPAASADNFDCRQKIYVVFEGTRLKKDKHILEGFWIKPNGKQQEYTRYEFEASKGKEVVWLWLELHPAGGKLFGAISPPYGREYFSGKWTVRLYLDGNFLTEKVFHVIC